MNRINTLRVFLTATALASAFGFSQAMGDEGGQPTIHKGVVGVQLRERGAFLVEDFKGDSVSKARWRIWKSNPKAVEFSTDNGRFVIRGENRLQYNGLWSLNAPRFKDVTLVSRMDIHAEGSCSHDLLLHLCGGDMPISPDHWVEVVMRDIGHGKVRFSAFAAVEKGGFTEADKAVVLERGPNEGFLTRLSLNGSTNLCTTEVQDADGVWREIAKPIPLYVRTTHCEIKMYAGRSPATSVGWFEDVRIYPRAVSHPILARLVMQDGSPIYSRTDQSWPPTVRIRDNKPIGLDELVVELWTADGKTRVSQVQSASFAHYMLPLDCKEWDVYPVGALIRVSCKGKAIGEAEIPLNGLEGLYPDDVYDVLLE